MTLLGQCCSSTLVKDRKFVRKDEQYRCSKVTVTSTTCSSTVTFKCYLLLSLLLDAAHEGGFASPRMSV